ncbi:hypothetical protein [Thermohalobacter berrensis]|uniref:Uncharacterized protein n=1 Tax=Thermohalobacter berrensis TaxID=99594 RepID=A0A419SUI6_9FIRM|nr:hypothetical protein [Thermohalobacter berrensis]RKD28848.1 hypothetical protein BET03_07400 [Thermohalobacter berrensis]
MYFFFILTITIAIITIYGIIKKVKYKREAGKVLFIIENLKIKRIIQVLSVLLIFTILYSFLKIKEFNLEDLFKLTFWILWLIYFLIIKDNNEKITEKGIIALDRFIKWENINYYKINRISQNRRLYAIILNVKLRSKFLKKEISRKIILRHKINESQKEEVEKLLKKHITKEVSN